MTLRTKYLLVLPCILIVLIFFIPAHWRSREAIALLSSGKGLVNSPGSSPYAIATFLNGDEKAAFQTPEEEEADRKADFYFIASRILTYQLLYAPRTRSEPVVPFVVLVSPSVTQAKREQLTRDGAVVIEAATVPTPEWIKTDVDRWREQFTKLRLFELTQYERLLFIDADTLLTTRIDGIFKEDMARNLHHSNFSAACDIKTDEAPVPPEHLFLARPLNEYAGGREHVFPPVHPPGTDFSAGFWLIAPSQRMFDYFLSVMQNVDRFNPFTMEQSLLNYAFRPDGPMPWSLLAPKWSATWPNEADLEGGVVSLHEKFWSTGPDKLVKLWWAAKDEMEMYWRIKQEIAQ